MGVLKFRNFMVMQFSDTILDEPGHKKTCFLHMEKQRCRSAPLFSLHR